MSRQNLRRHSALRVLIFSVWAPTVCKRAAVGGVVAVISYAVIMRESFSILSDVLSEDQWSRFHNMAMADIIASRVAQDKTQILTFRDRMRPGV